MSGQPVQGSLYVYAPDKGAPVFFTVAFAASAACHTWQIYHRCRYKCFNLTWLHPFCAVLFTVGYALREYGAFNYLFGYKNLAIFIVSQVFIYICPPLFELANYHVLGRMLYYVPYLSPLPPGRVRSTFGALMVVVEAVNAIGVSLAAQPDAPPSQQETGHHLTIAALAMQLCVITIFVCLASIFHRRCVRANVYVRAVSTPLATLYASTLLILIRCVYRVVQHSGNTTLQLDDLDALAALSPTQRYEWFFYVFEAVPMLANSVLWNVRHPGRRLPSDHHVYLARDGRSELEGDDKPDDRPLLLKTVSALSFGILFRRKEPWLANESAAWPDAQRARSQMSVGEEYVRKAH